MNKPIPPPTAYFKLFGIALIIRSRTPDKDNPKNKIPEQNTAAKPCCQVNPIAHGAAIVNAKNALRPIPGAKATG